jgi:hypothetical protein
MIADGAADWRLQEGQSPLPRAFEISEQTACRAQFGAAEVAPAVQCCDIEKRFEPRFGRMAIEPGRVP